VRQWIVRRNTRRASVDPLGDLRQAALARGLFAAAGLLKWLMGGPIGTAASRLAEIDVEPLDANALLGQAVAEHWQVFDQHRADGSCLSFETSDERSFVDSDVERQCAQLGRAQSQANLAAVLRCRERSGDAVQQAGSVDRT
jgi:hypothetical protein